MAISAQDYWNRVQTILQAHGFPLNNTITLNFNTKAEAKATLSKIIQLQKELKQVKREVAQTIKEIKAVYAQRKARISSSTGMASGLHIKGARNMGAQDKRRITREQTVAIAPYQQVSGNIDKVLLQFDGLKVKISANETK